MNHKPRTLYTPHHTAPAWTYWAASAAIHAAAIAAFALLPIAGLAIIAAPVVYAVTHY